VISAATSALSVLPALWSVSFAAFTPIHNLALFQGVHGMLDGASAKARETEWLYWVIFWICLAVYILVICAFTRAAAKTRVMSSKPLPIITNPEGDRRAAWAVGSALGLTVLTLFVVLFLSVATGKKVEGLTSKNPVTIDVTGHQWWWEIRYPDTQADQTVTTANEIHVPIDTPVVILTHSADVIHSFWPPNLSGKRDLLPGYSSAFWFKVEKPGVYRGQCAEFCGLQHAHMGFSVIAEPADDFAAWKQQQVKPAQDPAGTEQTRGREVFLTHACVLCHTVRGTVASSNYGPDLTHIASRQMIAAETLRNTPGNLAGWIVDPQGIKPGNKMAPNPLASDDLEALITYLQTLH
jgi:cytochrome c oxidase subunit 2